jgi:glycosyltransferase involved in cell wall biosynthesis
LRRLLKVMPKKAKQKKWKVGVNGWFFNKKFTGIGKYCLNLFSELARLENSPELIIAIPEKLESEAGEKFSELGKVKWVILPEIKWLKNFHKGLSKTVWEKWQLPKLMRREKVELIHLPYPALTRGNCPLVVTVHDTIPWTDEGYANRGFLSRIYNGAALKNFKRAEGVLTVSEAAKREIIQLTGRADSQVEVIYNACDFAFKIPLREEVKRRVKGKYGISEKPYLFYLGGFDKRKNVARLLKIFEKYLQAEWQLVLGGLKILDNQLYGDWDGAKNLQNVVLTGLIEEKDLPALFQGAEAYISLTTREGFNLPLLEAICSGCPALVSDLEVHREVGGEIPVYLNLEENDEKIAKKIKDVLNNDREKLKEKTERAESKFDWKKSAEKTLKIYQKISK